MAGKGLDHSAVVVGVGASLGLGAALCRLFAREGMHGFMAGNMLIGNVVDMETAYFEETWRVSSDHRGSTWVT